MQFEIERQGERGRKWWRSHLALGITFFLIIVGGCAVSLSIWWISDEHRVLKAIVCQFGVAFVVFGFVYIIIYWNEVHMRSRRVPRAARERYWCTMSCLRRYFRLYSNFRRGL